MRLAGILLAALIATGWSGTARAQSVVCNEIVESSLPCQLDTFSWAEVSFQTELQVLKDSQLEFERLIRLRVRNDMSFLKHETQYFESALKEENYSMDSSEMRRRGMISCRIWTVGTDFPVALHTKCTLVGYGSYDLADEFGSESLAVGPPAKIKQGVEDAIRNQIRKIATDFFETRDSFQKK